MVSATWLFLAIWSCWMIVGLSLCWRGVIDRFPLALLAGRILCALFRRMIHFVDCGFTAGPQDVPMLVGGASASSPPRGVRPAISLLLEDFPEKASERRSSTGEETHDFRRT